FDEAATASSIDFSFHQASPDPTPTTTASKTADPIQPRRLMSAGLREGGRRPSMNRSSRPCYGTGGQYPTARQVVHEPRPPAQPPQVAQASRPDRGAGARHQGLPPERLGPFMWFGDR